MSIIQGITLIPVLYIANGKNRRIVSVGRLFRHTKDPPILFNRIIKTEYFFVRVRDSNHNHEYLGVYTFIE